MFLYVFRDTLYKVLENENNSVFELFARRPAKSIWNLCFFSFFETLCTKIAKNAKNSVFRAFCATSFKKCKKTVFLQVF